jgi:hypothetical protein
VKKWFFVDDCLALAFSHKLPPPLPTVEKEEVSSLSWKRRMISRLTYRIIIGGEGLPIRLAWRPSFQRWI